MSSDKKLAPPTHLEPEYLFVKYEPLRKAVFSKFRDRMLSNADKEELASNISQIFIELVMEYDPNRGVDFPYYIKRMLELRTYHFITKHLKTVTQESLTGETLVVEDNSFDEIIKRILDLCSLNPDVQLGDKHRKLMEGVIIHQKTLKELADEEGVPSDRLHARLYFLLKKLTKVYEDDVAKYGKDLY